jgi:ankyrin repeat protein
MGNTPMHFAVAVNSLPMVKLLDDFGADAMIKNAEELCPIELA